MSTRGLLCLLLHLGLVAPIVRESPRYLYVSVPGSDLDRSNGGVSLLVFDVNRDHKFVKRVPIWPRAETTERVRGLRLAPSAANTGAPGKPLLYISTTRRLGAVDLASGEVRWENGYREHCCDQLDVSPDGRILYAPAFGRPEWYVIDPAGGALVSTVHVIGWPRSTAFSPDGRLAYLAAWESNRLSVADTATNALTRDVGPFSGYLCPFTTNRKGTLVFANIDGLVGFEVGDLQTGLVLDRVQVNGYTPAQLAAYECPSHGLALTSDERELWVADGVDNRLRIFDATIYPPVEKSSIQLTGQPRSVTFSRDGRLAYVSTGDVLDVASKRVVATLTDERGMIVQSEHMVESDMPLTARQPTSKQ